MAQGGRERSEGKGTAMKSSLGYLEYAALPVSPENMTPEMVEILDYWTAVRGDAFAPAWRDFHLHELPPTAIPMTVVVDLDQAADRIIYRFWGTGRTQLYGRDNTGRDVRDGLPDEAGPTVARQYLMVARARLPMLFRNVYPLRTRESSTGLTLRLPLSSDGETVDKVVAYATFLRNPGVFVKYVNPDGREATL